MASKILTSVTDGHLPSYFERLNSPYTGLDRPLMPTRGSNSRNLSTIGTLKGNSHIPYRAHTIPFPCRAVSLRL